jgi:hypothetical protein
MNFGYLSTLLPSDVMWGDPITPEIVREIVNAVDRKARGECAGIAESWLGSQTIADYAAREILDEIRETME